MDNTAWAAGIFEGEGCISIHKANSSVSLHVKMTDQDIVERFAKAVGVGHLERVSIRANTKPLYGWCASSKAEVLAVLDRLQPYFGKRRTERADEARERLKGVRSRGTCNRGHLISGSNLYVSPGGQRQCRQCARDRAARRIKT
jgi:hypothetical protein